MEEWRDITGYEGFYQVSNLGRIKSLSREVKNNNGSYFTKEVILNPSKTSKGYLRVNLSKRSARKTMLVHVLVAKAFIPILEGKSQVNHKDGVKTNNVVDNLEWVNNSENIQHSYDTGLNLKSKKVLCINTGEVFNSIREAGRAIGLKRPTPIYLVCSGKRKSTKGLQFKYLD
jgi:hypothetical protein